METQTGIDSVLKDINLALYPKVLEKIRNESPNNNGYYDDDDDDDDGYDDDDDDE
jgi:hypothetical protein